jgi:glyoxylase-like metal-dependent hydrolase (beta-lactamase superfamily II)
MLDGGPGRFRVKESNKMKVEPVQLRNGIVLFEGKISRHLMLDPMVSHTYLLEDEDEIIIFDPSCGKEIANRIEAHIRSRREVKAVWKKAILIAGHSHIDHANNFYLSEVIGAQETHIYVHESGFQGGRVMNEPAPFIEKVIEESKEYYNPYITFSFPYSLLMYPFAALDAVSPNLARKAFSRIAAIPWPPPVNGAVQPEPLKENDMQVIDLEDIKVKGWSLGNKIVLPTPGHSPCSVSLFWPERKALFVSDADWIGNPVFMSSSLKDCISSLEKMKELTEADKVELFLPAHGQVKEGSKAVLSHLDFHIRRLETMRTEVLSAYHSRGEEKDVRKLTGILVDRSPLFKMLKQINYPRLVVFVHNIVAVSLKEEGILN